MANENILELYRFKEGNGTYSAITTLVHIDDTTFIKGLASAIDTDDWKELVEYLKELGKKQMVYKRKDRWKQVALCKHSKYNPWFRLVTPKPIVKALT